MSERKVDPSKGFVRVQEIRGKEFYPYRVSVRVGAAWITHDHYECRSDAEGCASWLRSRIRAAAKERTT